MSPNYRDPSLAPDDASPEETDADIALITDYLSNELPPQAEAEVRRRLVDDEAFFEKVAPLLGLALLRTRARPKATPAEARVVLPSPAAPAPALVRRPTPAPRKWPRVCWPLS